MADDKDQGVVAEALDQCAVDFERGLNSHGSPTLRVPEKKKIFTDLRKILVESFHANLKDGTQKWHGAGGDGRRVTRIAFYLGAIAAFYADADKAPDPREPDAEPAVTQAHVIEAFEYVRARCAQRNDSRGKYCDWRGQGQDKDQGKDEDKDKGQDKNQGQDKDQPA